MRPTLTEKVLLIIGGRPALLVGNLPAHLQPFPWEEVKSSQPFAGRGKDLCPQRFRRLHAKLCMHEVHVGGTNQNTPHFSFCLFQQDKENIHINKQ